MNPRTLVATGIRTLLLSNSQIVGKVTGSDGFNRIYLQIAPGDAEMPYILMEHVFGGQSYRTPRPEIDALWLISTVAGDQPEAEEIDSLVFDTLEGSRPEFLENWVADQSITFSGSVAEVDTNQGVQAWKIGGYYRIRAIKNN